MISSTPSWTGGIGELGDKAGQRPVIVASARTPIGKAFKGSLASERPDEMVAQVIAQTLEQVPELAEQAILDDVLVGCGSPSGVMGFNIAKIATNILGLDEVPGATVNRYCASSVETTRQAANSIASGDSRFVISAGVESCSSYTHSDADGIPNTMNSRFMDAQKQTSIREESESTVPIWENPRHKGNFPDPYISMGQTAENVADLYGISRADQDEYALMSQQRVTKAAEQGFWSVDITPYVRSDGTVIDSDDSPRPATSFAKLESLDPVFRKQGTVTAGNSCPLSDGAASLVIGGEDDAKSYGIRPRARVLGTAVTGLSPEIMGMGPVGAVRKVLAKTGLALSDIDFVELNEAFAAQVLACQRELDIHIDKLNVNGGAIALGHPFGSTGARITNSLLNTLKARDGSLGLVTMCVGGGQGMAMVIERM